MIRRKKNRRQAMVEYLLMVAMIAGLAMRVGTTFKTNLQDAVDQCANDIPVNLTDVLTGRAGPGARNNGVNGG